MKSRYIPCERDGFPVLRLNGREQCLGEFIEECLQLKKVSDMVLRNGVFYYVFEDGHQLPMLCSCCDNPLLVNDLDASRKKWVGRQLKNILCDTLEIGEITLVDNLQLQFTRRFLEFKRAENVLSLLSAQKIIHPSSCTNKHRLPAKKKNKKIIPE